MAKVTGKARCVICNKEKSAVVCGGCQQIFCYDHLTEHRQQLSQQLDEIEINRDVFRQTLNEQTNQPQRHHLIQQIDQWEHESMQKIQQTANECRDILFKHTNEHFNQIEIKLTKLTDQLKQTRQENDYNEIDINQLKENLIELTKEIDQLPNILIQQDSSSFIKKISVVVSSKRNPSLRVNINCKWKQYSSTIAGGNGQGNELRQLFHPNSVCVDDDHKCIYIADLDNHRIVEWKYGANIGLIVAGGNGRGQGMNQLNRPASVIFDPMTDSLIICDCGNRRIVRWPRRNGTKGQIIISDIDCSGITMDNNGDIYVSDWQEQEVKRYKIEERDGIVVAGGNGQGNRLKQLTVPTFMFVDEDHSVYVSDHKNHRVMKWMRDAKEGIVVAGGNGQGNSLTQLSNPEGLIVDHLGNVYVADSTNHRVMCWSKGSKDGRVIVGGNGAGSDPNQFRHLGGLSFDRQNNLFVVDYENHRVQKFDIDIS